MCDDAKVESEDNCSELRSEIERLRTALKDLEITCNSLREIARVTMSHTGRRTIRFEVTNTSTGLAIIVCDPDGDEDRTFRRVAELFGPALCTVFDIDYDKVRRVGPLND